MVNVNKIQEHVILCILKEYTAQTLVFCRLHDISIFVEKIYRKCMELQFFTNLDFISASLSMFNK